MSAHLMIVAPIPAGYGQFDRHFLRPYSATGLVIDSKGRAERKKYPARRTSHPTCSRSTAAVSGQLSHIHLPKGGRDMYRRRQGACSTRCCYPDLWGLPALGCIPAPAQIGPVNARVPWPQTRKNITRPTFFSFNMSDLRHVHRRSWHRQRLTQFFSSRRLSESMS